MARFQYTVLVSLLILVSVLTAAQAFGFGNRNGPNQQERRRQRPISSHFRQRFGNPRSNRYNNQYNNQYNNNYGNPAQDERQVASAVNPANEQREAPQSYVNTQAQAAAVNSYYAGGYDGRSNDYDSGYGHVNPLSALVAPLAALALLGAAAAVSTSPVLLSLAVLTNGRKRRDLNAVDNADIAPEIQEKLREIEVLEKYIAKVPEHEKQQEKLMATYMSCSGYTEEENTCMERVVCEYSVTPNKMAPLEKDTISIVLYNIMSNNYLDAEFKDRLRAAAQYGRNRGQCSAFSCSQLAKKDQ